MATVRGRKRRANQSSRVLKMEVRCLQSPLGASHKKIDQRDHITVLGLVVLGLSLGLVFAGLVAANPVCGFYPRRNNVVKKL